MAHECLPHPIQHIICATQNESRHVVISHPAFLIRGCLMCSSPLLAASFLWLPGQLGLLQQVQQLRLHWQQRRPANAESVRYNLSFTSVPILHTSCRLAVSSALLCGAKVLIEQYGSAYAELTMIAL